ncbi:MAG: CPBP family intramembrane glutamic endopeptidase [Candidatus Izemoplasmataceae bacterium]
MKPWLKYTLMLVAIALIYGTITGTYIMVVSFLKVFSGEITGGESPLELAQILGNHLVISLILAQVITTYLIYILVKKEGFASSLYIKPLSVKHSILAVLLGIAALQLSTLIITGLSILFPNQVALYIENAEGLTSANIILVVISIGLFAPIFEELFLRGLFFRYFDTLLSPKWLIFLSALAFAIFHANFIQGAFAFTAGLVMAYAFYITKNILVPILIHLGHNLFSVFLSLDFAVDIQSRYPLMNTLILVLGILFIPILLLYFKQETKKIMISP